MLAIFNLVAVSLQRLEAPPVLNSPTYSLATLGPDGTTNMQILTYATPVGISPRLWAVSLYRPTLTHANWLARRSGVLQFMCEPHAPLVYSLGGQSGSDSDKAAACSSAGFTWLDPLQLDVWGDDLDDDGGATAVRLLPGCAAYLRLVQVGELTPCGEHDLALCRVEGILALPGGPTTDTALQTRDLRAAGIISDKGRAIGPEAA